MLLITSTLFATNAYHALIKGHLMYGSEFILLFLTSLWYHYDGKYNNRRAFICDQAAIMSIVLTGGYYTLMLPIEKMAAPVLSFLITCLIYKMQLRHEFVHLISCIGHHIIIGLS